jgi:hypothetical protein
VPDVDTSSVNVPASKLVAALVDVLLNRAKYKPAGWLNDVFFST